MGIYQNYTGRFSSTVKTWVGWHGTNDVKVITKEFSACMTEHGIEDATSDQEATVSSAYSVPVNEEPQVRNDSIDSRSTPVFVHMAS